MYRQGSTDYNSLPIDKRDYFRGLFVLRNQKNGISVKHPGMKVLSLKSTKSKAYATKDKYFRHIYFNGKSWREIRIINGIRSEIAADESNY